jgi:hypothetical protein
MRLEYPKGASEPPYIWVCAECYDAVIESWKNPVTDEGRRSDWYEEWCRKALRLNKEPI